MATTPAAATVRVTALVRSIAPLVRHVATVVVVEVVALVAHVPASLHAALVLVDVLFVWHWLHRRR